MLARTVGSPGAVAAMFTYRGSDDPAKVQEADIEILTRDPSSVIQYTNQPSDLPDKGEIAEATRNTTLPGGGAWSDWAVHRLDWTPERSVWCFNGAEVANIKFQVPREASSINFNSWSDGGSWSGSMTVGGEASLQIQWIEMLYNTTDASKRSVGSESGAYGLNSGSLLARKAGKHAECQLVCTVDQSSEIGRPVVLSNDTESNGMAMAAPHPARLGGLLAFAWTVVCMTIL